MAPVTQEFDLRASQTSPRFTPTATDTRESEPPITQASPSSTPTATSSLGPLAHVEQSGFS